MTSCPACGAANDPGRKFCRQCGARLWPTCPACGAAYEPGDRFCGQCGAALPPVPVASPSTGATGGAPGGASAAGDPATAPVSERRLVSVLFADLVGFTSFAEARDAEDVRAVLGRYFDVAAQAVRRHGGTVEKFIGDAVMAVWGTPVAHEDDAERAVRSALEVVDSVTALGTELGVPLQARAGVLTGEAVATVGATDQGLVTGDLVNTASRLQSAAEPGTVLVGEATMRAAAGAVAFSRVDDLTLKGKQHPVPAWRALRVIAELRGAGRRGTPEPPFTGRDEELRLLKELLHGTGRERRPRLVSMVGVAGIGKSRLAWELRKYVDGLAEQVLWHEGHCPSYGEGVTFGAFAEMVRYRAGIADTDADDDARRALAECVRTLCPDDDERRWVTPRLEHLLGLAPAPPGDRDELFAAWRRFVERVAEHGTTVLVFDDVHWADAGLLDFVESLLTSCRSSPVLVLTLGRPELLEHRPDWGAALGNATGLRLDRLGDDEIRAMVVGHVEDLPDDDVDRIVVRAEGVPLYAVETVRMLVDRGLLAQEDTCCRLLPGTDLDRGLDVPETLHALVTARLDGLAPDERALVQDAAVYGQSFTVAGLAAVAGRPEPAVEDALRRLTRKEIVVPERDPRSPQRGQYHFGQSVIREVAYGMLARPARRGKHLACARWFESLHEDDLAGVVAGHYLAAYRATPTAADSPGDADADAEETRTSARTWLARAAERAFSLGSPQTAAAFAEDGLDLATGPADRAALLDTLALAAAYDGAIDDALRYAMDACDAHEAAADLPGAARLLARLRGPSSVRTGTLPEVGARLADVERRLDGAAIPERALALAALADMAAETGELERALLLSEEALGLGQRLGDDDVIAAAAAARVWAVLNDGRHWEAELLMHGLLDLARRRGRRLEEARALLELGVIASESDPRGALQAHLESAEAAARAGIRPLELVCLSNAAEQATDLGELRLAEELLGRIDERSRGWGDPSPVFTRLQHAALLGRTADVDELRRRIAGLTADARQLQMRTWVLKVAAFADLLAGDAAAALAGARAAVALEPGGANTASNLWIGVHAAARLHDEGAVRDLLVTAHALRGRWADAVRATATATLAALAGDGDAAVAGFRDVLGRWSDMGLPLDHAWTSLDACWTLPRGSLPAADVAAARAYVAALPSPPLVAAFDRALDGDWTPAAGRTAVAAPASG